MDILDEFDFYSHKNFLINFEVGVENLEAKVKDLKAELEHAEKLVAKCRAGFGKCTKPRFLLYKAIVAARVVQYILQPDKKEKISILKCLLEPVLRLCEEARSTATYVQTSDIYRYHNDIILESYRSSFHDKELSPIWQGLASIFDEHERVFNSVVNSKYIQTEGVFPRLFHSS
jgi:hypothetical protein